MDASGTGGTVILTDYDVNSNSLKWLYDGRNLRLRHNTDLCLDIEGGISLNKEKLIVSPCGENPSSAWLEYSISSSSGTVQPGDTSSHLLCPVGSKVINISGRSGWFVDQLVITCDDGNKTVLGPVGGSGGSTHSSSDCVSGYSSVNVTSGKYIGQIIASCSASPRLTVMLGAGNASEQWAIFVSQCDEWKIYWSNHSLVLSIAAADSYVGSRVECSGSTDSLDLYDDKLIIGMQVNSGRYINSVAWLYRSTMVAQTASPSMKPSSTRPSFEPSKRPTNGPKINLDGKSSAGFINSSSVSLLMMLMFMFIAFLF